jgi:hypothetical protein
MAAVSSKIYRRLKTRTWPCEFFWVKKNLYYKYYIVIGGVC